MGLVRLHAHGSLIFFRYVLMFVALCCPYACNLYIEIKPKAIGTALSIQATGLSSQPSIHTYTMTTSLGSVIRRDSIVLSCCKVRRSVCVVCTAVCLVELDLISGARSDTIYHILRYKGGLHRPIPAPARVALPLT
jgi:hypothetical protein